MSKEMQIDIRNQIKQALNLVIDDVINDTKLLGMLRDARIAKHPDKFLDEDAKKTAEEEFKKLNALLKSFLTTLEQEKASSPAADIAIYQERFTEIDRISQLATSEDEVFALKSKIKDLEINLSNKDREIEQLQQQNSILSQQRLNENIAGLDEIYKPLKSTKVAGYISLIILTLSNITVVKNNFTQICSIPDSILNVLCIAIVIISILLVSFNKLCDYRLSVLRSLVSSLSTLQDIKIKTTWRHYKTQNIINETDIEEFVASKMANLSKFDKLIFRLKSSQIKTELKQFIITELISKRIVSFGPANGLDREFLVESN